MWGIVQRRGLGGCTIDSIKYRLKWIDVEKRTFLHFRWCNAPYSVGRLQAVSRSTDFNRKITNFWYDTKIRKLTETTDIKFKYSSRGSNRNYELPIKWLRWSCRVYVIHSKLFIYCLSGIFIVYQSVHVMTAISAAISNNTVAFLWFLDQFSTQEIYQANNIIMENFLVES